MALQGSKHTNIIVRGSVPPCLRAKPLRSHRRVIILYPNGRMRPSLVLIRGDRRRASLGGGCTFPPSKPRLPATAVGGSGGQRCSDKFAKTRVKRPGYSSVDAAIMGEIKAIKANWKGLPN